MIHQTIKLSKLKLENNAFTSHIIVVTYYHCCIHQNEVGHTHNIILSIFITSNSKYILSDNQLSPFTVYHRDNKEFKKYIIKARSMIISIMDYY
jgi:hypothetical protein